MNDQQAGGTPAERFDPARQRRVWRRTLATSLTLAALLALAALWVPVANTYRGNVQGNAVSTHQFGVLSWAKVSWWGPVGEFWPLSRLSTEVSRGRTFATAALSGVLFLPLIWFRIRVVRIRGRACLALIRREARTSSP